jgi:hypothetical protein
MGVAALSFRPDEGRSPSVCVDARSRRHHVACRRRGRISDLDHDDDLDHDNDDLDHDDDFDHDDQHERGAADDERGHAERYGAGQSARFTDYAPPRLSSSPEVSPWHHRSGALRGGPAPRRAGGEARRIQADRGRQ